VNGILDRLFGVFRLEFDTIRDLEHKGFRVFWIAGGTLAAGILLTLTAIGIFLGVPLIIVGALLFLGAMLWMSAHSKEPTRRIFCPYCSTFNEVFLSRTEFACDVCKRRIGFDEDSEPVALDFESID
jgi:hypothetical protein